MWTELKIYGSPEDRFQARIIRDERDPGACWGWRGSRDKKGYARMWNGEKVQLAHRFSWCLHFGEIPIGLCVLHRCDNPPCSNPNHLFLGTRAENNLDMRRKKRQSAKGLFSAERFEKFGHPRAKVTRADVELIRSLYQPRQVTKKDLAARFGISEATIKKILAGRTWK